MTEQEVKLLTVAFLIALATLTIGYDVWVIRCYGPGGSISRVCGEFMRAYPCVTAWVLIGLGVYIGHVIGD